VGSLFNTQCGQFSNYYRYFLDYCLSLHKSQSWLSEYKCSLVRRNNVLPVSFRRSVTAYSYRVTITARHANRFHLTVNSLQTSQLLAPSSFYHWTGSLRDLVLILPGMVRHSAPTLEKMPPAAARCFQNSHHSFTVRRCLTPLCGELAAVIRTLLEASVTQGRLRRWGCLLHCSLLQATRHE
jgi:hypothetical protein